MEIHGTHPSPASQEIRCADCGHRFLVSSEQRSARCSVCGNIESLSLREVSRGLLSGLLKSMPLSGEPGPVVVPEVAPPESAPPDLATFLAPADGLRVQTILHSYHVEWQLWAVLVKNFADSAYHGAYISYVLSRREFDRASDRYREHRSVMMLSSATQWQAEVADLMLERIEQLAAMKLGSERGYTRADIWRGWLYDWWMRQHPTVKLFFGLVLAGILMKALGLLR